MYMYILRANWSSNLKIEYQDYGIYAAQNF